jgi:hypothetical protein
VEGLTETLKHHKRDGEKLDDLFFTSSTIWVTLIQIVKEGKLDMQNVLEVLPEKFQEELKERLKE